MPNNNIIKKCLDELGKKEFRKDYVVGMLETLYELGGGIAPTPAIHSTAADEIKPAFAAGSKKSKKIEEDYEPEEIPSFLQAGPVGKISN